MFLHFRDRESPIPVFVARSSGLQFSVAGLGKKHESDEPERL